MCPVPMRRYTAALLPLGLLLMVSTLPAQTPTPVGTWRGSWNSPDGSIYAATVQLTVAPDGVVDGAISWTLTETRRADLLPKVGQSGIEYVHGTYDARCRVLSIAGYRLDDPRQILGMDRYELILAANGGGLGGVTENQGAWTGMLSLRR